MVIANAARPALALVLLLALTACADRPVGPPQADVPTPVDLPVGDDALVLRVEFVGGFVTPDLLAARLPLASVYADGRVITEGPVPAIHPGPAWPDVQVHEIGRDGVQALAVRALDAGVAETTDLGTPPLADVPSTRFTLVSAADTHVREVYGLTETAGMPGTGLTAAQEAAREALRELLAEVTGQTVAEGSRSWTPAAVAAVVRPWAASEDDVAAGLTPDAVPWPGPSLPGDLLGSLPELSCVTATGEEGTAVVSAARGANALTPWETADGGRWTVTFRPLLPDETGCADLT